MSYSIKVSGPRAQARATVAEQMDSAIALAQATQQTKVAALAVVDALEGDSFTIQIDGHTDDPAQVPKGEKPRSNFTCMVTAQ